MAHYLTLHQQQFDLAAFQQRLFEPHVMRNFCHGVLRLKPSATVFTKDLMKHHEREVSKTLAGFLKTK